MSPPKTAVFGATSYIGSYFSRYYSGLYSGQIAFSRDELDLERPDIHNLCLEENGFKDALISCGITQIDECKRDPAKAKRVNVEGTLELAKQLIDRKIRPIFLSSDYVFDGKNAPFSEDSETKPETVYGLQKKQVEEALPSICGNQYLIVRLSKVYSQSLEDHFLGRMIRELASGNSLRLAFDQRFCPTLVEDIVQAVSHIQCNPQSGIFHVSCPESFSWWEIGLQVAREFGFSEKLLKKISLEEFDIQRSRPRDITLRSKKIDHSFIALPEAINQLKSKLQQKSTQGP